MNEIECRWSRCHDRADFVIGGRCLGCGKEERMSLCFAHTQVAMSRPPCNGCDGPTEVSEPVRLDLAVSR